MHKWDTSVKRGHAGTKRRGGVALAHDAVRPCFGNDPCQHLQATSSQIRQRLIRLHEIQVMIDSQPEVFHDLIEHLAMLPREAHDRSDLWVSLRSQNQRRHFDGFGTSSKNTEHAKRHDRILPRVRGGAMAFHSTIASRHPDRTSVRRDETLADEQLWISLAPDRPVRRSPGEI